MAKPDLILDCLWPFVRGDTPPHEFEQWAYRSSELEALLPRDLHLELLSTDYTDKDSVFLVRKRLAEFARQDSRLGCECPTLPDLADVPMSELGCYQAVLRTLDEKTRRGDPFWWLFTARCSECNQWWLVASEERINDVVFLRRLTDSAGQAIVERNEWPSEFDRFSTLLELGRVRGHRARFVDPLSPGLVYTAIDLATEDRSLDTARLAHLLQIDLPHAEALAEQAELAAMIKITRSPRA